MTDKDPKIKSVDDRDQAYYNEVFEDYGDNGDRPRSFDEEYAAEAAVDPRLVRRNDVTNDDVGTASGTGMGWLALALSIIGLFFLPFVMGIAGIIVGFVARRQGARALGAWAIGIGIAVIILRLVAAPFL
ncbi:MAG TPA: DUF4190 domain-containing protein [Candidatus Angelobacter sp.]|nr:DUF4190 domain-containing protein [Candidatus Angelobacter sp.]